MIRKPIRHCIVEEGINTDRDTGSALHTSHCTGIAHGGTLHTAHYRAYFTLNTIHCKIYCILNNAHITLTMYCILHTVFGPHNKLMLH